MSLIWNSEWHEANRHYLMARLSAVRAALVRLANPDSGEDSSREVAILDVEQLSPSPALDEICSAFELSTFERDILLMCTGMELDPDFAQVCADAHGNPQLNYPSFNLALAALPDAHWTAVTPVGALRYWRLIEVGPGNTLTSSPLKIDERVLHYLVGVGHQDERLRHFVEFIPTPSSIPASYEALGNRIIELWANQQEWPVIQLSGEARSGKQTLAAASCFALGLRLHVLRSTDIPASAIERRTLLNLWEREARLSHSALLLECDTDDSVSLRNAQQFAESLRGPIFIDRNLLRNSGSRKVAQIEITISDPKEQRAQWETALGPLAAQMNGQLDVIASQFRLDPESIRSVAEEVEQPSSDDMPFASVLWEACRKHSRNSLNNLAERIETNSQWEDLILPDEQYQTLREIAAHVRQRVKVYESWGFGEKNPRGLGITAMFAGQSGTGKTLAAEVLANDLRLDLYRIDLSQVVSKYIGETEKNLRVVFDAAETSGAVLLFDEADALFGKRSEVKDSHDRYANIEVSYLLQRMEAYRGLAILTTNRRSSLDAAFLRRIRFVLTFPFPDATQRARIWRHIFPADTPTYGLDFEKLARLNVTGGNIRNIALNAAFLAADMSEPVRMSHLLRTARSECTKIEKQMTSAETGGWV